MLGILILQRNIQKELQKKIKNLVKDITNPEKITQEDKQYISDLDYDEIEFPVHEKDFSKIEAKIIFVLMYLVMKMGWFLRFLFQIKNLKIQWICCF